MKNLVITAGESWTWGDSLSPETREDKIYGKLIANNLDAEFINVAECGKSNSWILINLQKQLNEIDFTKFKNIYIVCTFTEAGRDFHFKDSWLENYTLMYKDYLNNLNVEFYEKVINDTENLWLQKLIEITDNLPNNAKLFFGQNFAWNSNFFNHDYKNTIKLENTWIEVIAQKYNLHKPKRTKFVTGWIFEILDAINDILCIEDKTIFKQWCLDYIDPANEVNTWFKDSPVNGSKYSKHPTELGHKIWSDYITDIICKRGGNNA